MKLEITLHTDMIGLVGCRREDSGPWAFCDVDELEVANVSFYETREESHDLIRIASEVFIKVLTETGGDWKIVQIVPRYLGESDKSLSRIALHLKVWKGFFREWLVNGENEVPDHLATAERSNECMVTVDDGVYCIGCLCMGLDGFPGVLQEKSLKMPPSLFVTDMGEDVVLSDEYVVEMGKRFLSSSESFADYLLSEGNMLVNRMDFGGIQPSEVCSLVWKKGLLTIDESLLAQSLSQLLFESGSQFTV